jgi:hypothetical protein
MAAALAPLLFSLFITVEKYRIRKSMKEAFETHDLQTLRVPQNQVKWMDDHEIWINEKMFDILGSKLEDGVYTFTGLYDHEETKLVKMEKQGSPVNEKQTALLAQAFKSLPAFVIEHNQLLQPIPVTEYSCHKNFPAENGFHKVITPPPRAFHSI